MKKILYIILFVFAIRAEGQALYFPPNAGTTWDTIPPQSLNWCQDKIDDLYDFLDSNNTKAFIVLKKGKIVLEKYFGSFTQDSLWYWASAGKSLTAYMVGIAQQEGYLSLSDTTSDYLGTGWTSCTSSQEDKITIRNQLTMTTGLNDSLPYMDCTADSCLIYKADAGTRWAYHDGPYTLLHKVVQVATGTTFNTYIAQKLKTPTGMNGAFVNTGTNDIYFSTARSMARFGLLIENKGNWNGTQLLTDSIYYQQMLNSSQGLNPSYGYLWWLNGKSSYMVPQMQTVFPGSLAPDAPSDMVAAIGKNGQFINVVPSQDLVLIRMGNAPTSSLVPFLLDNEIWQYMNKLPCIAGISKNTDNNAKLQVFPNPASESIQIRFGDASIEKLEITSLQGEVVRVISPKELSQEISVTKLDKGVYFLREYFTNGKIYATKFVKE